MIICPICKEEIEDDSHFCDQCGEALLYCSKCGRVGVGRRCTYCGGMMVFIGEQKQTAYKSGSPVDMSAQIFKGVTSSTRGSSSLSLPGNDRSMPKLILENTSLNNRGRLGCHYRSQPRTVSRIFSEQQVCFRCPCTVGV